MRMTYCSLIKVVGRVIKIVSGRLWKPRGRISCHSREEGWWEEEITLRCATSLSQRIKMNRRRATNEIIDPRDETTFHFVNASG